ncbi:MAG: hypothetical protein VB051_03430 [Candidatus Pelethousia sp.]|nr:hypothetical protein [Candidatus Pelethousia sp.]
MEMPDYKAMYVSLFNALTDAVNILKSAQIKSEDAYLEAEQTEPVLSLWRGGAPDSSGNKHK